jgi:hypothetical protein
MTEGYCCSGALPWLANMHERQKRRLVKVDPQGSLAESIAILPLWCEERHVESGASLVQLQLVELNRQARGMRQTCPSQQTPDLRRKDSQVDQAPQGCAVLFACCAHHDVPCDSCNAAKSIGKRRCFYKAFVNGEVLFDAHKPKISWRCDLACRSNVDCLG